VSPLNLDRLPSMRHPPLFASFVALASATVVLGGCALMPRSAAPSQTLRATDSYATQRSFAAPAAQWPTDEWWRAYGDPQLDALMDQALRDSPTLASAQARVAKAESLAQQAGAALWPRVTANGSVQKSKQSYNQGIPAAFVPQGYNYAPRGTLDFSYEFDFFGRNRAALAAATSEAEAARADAALARLSLSTTLAGAYADFAQLFADRDAAAEAVRIREQSSTLTLRRFTGGLENQGAADQADAGAAAAREQLAALDESIGLTRNRLAALLGAGPDRGLLIERPDVRKLGAFGLPADLQANLIGRRPDIIAARLRAESARQRIRESRAAFYPNINLAAYIGQQSLGLDLFTRAGSSIGAVGPAISLPVFEGGRLRATYRGAIADYDNAVASYNSSVTQALQDVSDAAVSMRALDGRIAESHEALTAAKHAYDIALRRYQGGVATYLEVLTAEDALINNQRTLADLRARAFSLDVALVRALGGGFAAG
jgi:NodT family efflux transporter outer membrane factor (OMF) lipoprotein